VTLTVNGQKLQLMLEPRVTLLDALRNYSSLTGAKEGCDRAACGACTVLLDGLPIYSCQKLAIEAQGREITTVEGLAKNGELTKVQQAFLDKDALQCGYCTPGISDERDGVAEKNPHPTADDVKHACAGNLCRCGTHPHILQAALKAAGVETAPSKTEVIELCLAGPRNQIHQPIDARIDAPAKVTGRRVIRPTSRPTAGFTA
jgi:xanthine dehydrogenase YagT iron-sulfur-binding subunit